MSLQFYKTPQTLPEEINAFEKTIQNFRNGGIHPTKFKGIRVAFGVYEQRKEDTYMMRVRCSAGGITPKQLLKASEIADQYAKDHVHVTTRQEIQLHYVALENVTTVMKELLKVGLSTRGGGGNTVRNIMASYDSGVNANEVFDVEPHAIALSTRMLKESDSWNLPRKFKMTFSSSPEDNANATMQCVGFIAKMKDGKRGFEVWVAGGMGAKPRLGKLFYEWIPEEHVYHTVKAIKNMFHKYGNRRNKHKSRLRFLWDQLGEEEFRNKYQEERDAIGNDPSLALKLETLENQAPKKIDLKPFQIPTSSQKEYDLWMSRYVTPQKQDNLYSIEIPLILGDFYNKDIQVLANVLEPFGENVLRCSMNQNMHIRNIPKEYLGNIFETLSKMTNLLEKPKLYSNMIACTGADTCKLGICLPRGVTPAIQKKFNHNPALRFDEMDDVKIHISGCPNSCGQHHSGDLGFHGKVRRQGGRAYPSYNVLGGAIVKTGESRFGEDAGWVHARDLPGVIGDILLKYQEKKESFASFSEYFDDGGKEEIIEITKKYNENIPDFGDDKNYYFDWGAEEVFSTKGMGQGECSAGMFDMIDVDVKAIRSHKTTISTSEKSEEIQESLQDILFHGCRMLLVTRGIDPKTESEIYDHFKKAFIETKLVDSKFEFLVQAGKEKKVNIISENQDMVIEFGDSMIKLYNSMDNSMRFPGEEEVMALQIEPERNTTNSSTDTTKVSKQVDSNSENTSKPNKFKDFRGIACPMNFVKTKIELSPMKSGETLEILLDDGAPIDNVPRSVVSEGHKILEQKQIDNDYWSVLIQKN